MGEIDEWGCFAGEFPNGECDHAHLQHEVWGAGNCGSLGVDPRALLLEFVSGIFSQVFSPWNTEWCLF